MSGAVRRLSRVAGCGSRRPGSGREERPLELGLRAEPAGVEEIDDRPEVADVVLDRRAGQGDAVIGLQRPRGLGLLGLRVLDVLGSSRTTASQGTCLQDLEVAVQEGVARQDQGVLRGASFEGPTARVRP